MRHAGDQVYIEFKSHRRYLMAEKTLPAALAPLEPLLNDPAVIEILVDRPDRVLCVRADRLQDTDIRFASADELRTAIDAVLTLGNTQFAPGQTIAEVRLADDSRALAVLPPTAVDGPYLILRKIFRSPVTLENLFEHGAINREAFALIESAIQARKNILIAGGTASGKTTLLNILIDHIPADERVITVEEAVELQPHHPRLVRMAAEQTPGLTYAEVIHAAARMLPERLIFGELRGAEVMSILEIIGRGHDGSLMSMHATSAEDALSRLEAMCLMANLGLGLGEIRYGIATALNVIITQMRLPLGQRRIKQITEIQGLENDRYLLQPLMRYHEDTGTFEMTGAAPSWSK
jgi:pilus assembly protein CpaF